MSTTVYHRYFAKDKDGNYRADVVEPEGGRPAWPQRRLALREAKKREIIDIPDYQAYKASGGSSQAWMGAGTGKYNPSM